CVLGDKYGTVGPPVRIPKGEFETIRAAVFEQSADLKLLDQHYVLDRSSEEEEYRLNTYLEDEKQRAKLSKVVQKGAQSAFDGSQLTVDRQRRFFWSSLHKIAAVALERNCRCTVVLRKFDVSDHKFGPHILPFSGNQIDILGILERLKTTPVLFTHRVPTRHVHTPAGYAIDETRRPNIREGLSCGTFQTAVVCAQRSGLKAESCLPLPTPGGVFLLQGPELCGKTQALCRLYDQAPATVFKIIRFIDLTYSSVFAHEVWRQINLELCALTAKDPRPVISAFKFKEQLKIFDEMLATLDGMLYLFLDDVHLLKYGPFMSTIEKRLQKAPSTLAVFMTASNVSPISSTYTITQTLNLDVPSDDDIIEILKRSVVGRKVNSAQWSTIKQQLTGSNRSILVGQVLLDQVLQRKNGVMSGGIQGRLERIEAELGALSVQSLCSFIVLAPHGLTRLELFDLLSNKVDLIARLGAVVAFPSLLLDRIVESLGNMDALKDMALCQFDFIDSAVRTCSMVHLLSMYEECAMQRDNNSRVPVLCEQVLIPAIPTVLRDREQLAAEVIGRLRYTRAENSHFLNTLVEQAMTWVDNYNRQPLLVPLSCWIAPPQMKTCRTFTIKVGQCSQLTITWSTESKREERFSRALCDISSDFVVTSTRCRTGKQARLCCAPTFNHQHVLISGNQSAVGVIYMYHIAAQSLMTTFNGHTGNVTSLSCSTSGTFFVSTSTDKSVRIWSLISGECMKDAHTALAQNHLLCAGQRRHMIDLESGEVLKSFTEHTGSVVSLQLTVNNEFLITGSGDFIVQMWSLETGRCISRMGGLMAPVSCIAITSNDAFVIVACEDETLRVFSTVAAQELHELMGHEGRVNALACAQDDCQLFAATKSIVYCYDIHNGQIVDVLDCQLPFAVFNIKISSTILFLFSVWSTSRCVAHPEARSRRPRRLRAHGIRDGHRAEWDDKIAACGTYEWRPVAVWDLDICQCSTKQGYPGVLSGILLQPDVSAQWQHNRQRQRVRLLLGHLAPNIQSAFHGDRVDLSAGELPGVQLRQGGQTLSVGDFRRRGEHGDERRDAPPIFAPPNGKLVVGHCPKNSKEMKVDCWRGKDAVVKNKLSHNEEITCFAAIALGTLVATGSSDQSCKLWQIDSGYLTQVLVGHEGRVTCVALADDERLVISGAEDKKVIVWNVSTGDIAHSLVCTAPLTAVSLSSDGCVAFSASEDGWLESWSTEKGNLLSSFNAHRPIRQVLNSLDANRLLVQLSSCAQLPILCLHNSPASSHPQTQRRRSARSHSITSLGNDNAGPSVEQKTREGSNPSLQVGNGHPTPPRSAQPRPTFDKLDRDQSKGSIIEKDRSTTLTGAAPVAQKSHLCTLL
ncbi:WD domain, G-beta repeat protein, partial [Ostertagia ostertagi]